VVDAIGGPDVVEDTQVVVVDALGSELLELVDVVLLGHDGDLFSVDRRQISVDSAATLTGASQIDCRYPKNSWSLL
jgi:hypothetical protein